MRFLAILFFAAFCLFTARADVANGGHQISVKLKNYEESQLFLGYHYGDKQYLQDTVERNARGLFVFEGEEPLPPGVYLVVMPPDNKYFQLLVTNEEQKFQVFADAENPTRDIRFENAPDNALFYEYLSFLEKKKPMADELAEKMQATEDEGERKALQEKRSVIDQEVREFQDKLIRKAPQSLTAAIIEANLPLETPEFEGTEEEVQLKRWRYTQDHYFDNLDLADPRMLRTPFLFQRVDYYVHKLQVQHPDSIALAVGRVLERMKPAEETFKFYLIHFLNEYAKSNIVGMDAVYVFLVNNYYAKGLAPWTDEDQLDKIIENAKALEPLLIGKTAPNISLQKRDGTPFELYDVDAEYTILYFWRYDCGHCKKSTPDMKAFYEKFKDKGIKIVAVCTKFTDEIPDCWKYVDENEIGDWIHAVDTYHRSRFMSVYNIKTTPQIYVLDRNKEILSKRIGAEQLEEVIDKIIEMREKE
ncbi:MAG: AhpC/TSA family protein [Phaeodactylibacter sp.]|nr:AhpC/TSA family protein [Phaeodactylibacter sp.]MCB9297362.1 AhpC/TSA family protein [Lewinellaceae bacterium]